MTTCPCCKQQLPPSSIIVDLPTNTIVGPGGSIVVQPKLTDLVAMLLEAGLGTVTPSPDIERRLWGMRMPPDANNLRVLVSYGRLGVRSRPGIRSIGLEIEHVAKRGYRLVVIETAETARTTDWRRGELL